MAPRIPAVPPPSHPPFSPPAGSPGYSHCSVMNTLPLSSIIIPENRQRQEFEPGALLELQDSIMKHGLFHPPVVRFDADGKALLVAGERRLRAMKEIFSLGETFWFDGKEMAGVVPYNDIGQLDPLEAEEAELDENLKRRDLTWQEHAAAVERLHNLRGAQKMAAAEAERPAHVHPSAVDFRAIQTVADTAREVFPQAAKLPPGQMGEYQSTVRKEIIVARNLHNPAVKAAKTVKEAYKVLKAQETREKNVELARVVGQTFTAESHFAYNEDCLKNMRDCAAAKPEGMFDVICTDPPYGMGADAFGDGGGKMTGIEHNYSDSYESWKELMTAWCPLSFAVAKAQAHAYVFCDIDRFHELKAMMEAAGWYVFRTPFISIKPNSGRVPLPDCGPRRQWEMILYAIKGKKAVNHIVPDVISSNADEQLGHGAQKPVSVFQNLLQRSVKPGDWVLDSFAGTGPIFPAAHALKCIAVGVENDPASYAICLKRLQQLKASETTDIFAGLEK